MSHTETDRISTFILEGYFVGFVWESGKFKAVRIAVGDEELEIKLSKAARSSCHTTLYAGDRLQIFGHSKIDPKSGQLKLKAYQIEKKPISETTVTTTVDTSDPQTPSLAKKVKLLLCKKSGCEKKGGKKQHHAIAEALRDRGLQEFVTLQETGCLGKCSLAPNVMLMPGKQRLSGMKPTAIVDLLLQLKQH